LYLYGEDRTFNFDGIACKTCPLGGECLGGDRLESRAGWWRSAGGSEVLFACPFAAACTAGNATNEAACAAGYRGPVCGRDFSTTPPVHLLSPRATPYLSRCRAACCFIPFFCPSVLELISSLCKNKAATLALGICEPGYRRWGAACVACGETSTFALPLLGLLGFGAFIVYIFVVPANDSANKACLFSSLIFIAQCLGLLKDYDVTLPSGIDKLVDTLNLANFNLAALAPGCSDSEVNFYRNYLTGVAVGAVQLLNSAYP
jgi:hypothetical protein